MNAPRLSADARRQQIIDVAIDVFGNEGYYGASMNDIADAAGVTKPVLYQHFDSKSDLYRALLDEVASRMLEAISKATADARSGKEQTEAGFQAYFRWVSHRHDEFRLLFGGGARHDAEFSGHIRRTTNAVADAIAPLIAADIDDADRDTIAHAIVGIAEGASRHLVTVGSEFDPDAVARLVSSLAWAGLRSLHRTD